MSMMSNLKVGQASKQSKKARKNYQKNVFVAGFRYFVNSHLEFYDYLYEFERCIFNLLKLCSYFGFTKVASDYGKIRNIIKNGASDLEILDNIREIADSYGRNDSVRFGDAMAFCLGHVIKDKKLLRRFVLHLREVPLNEVKHKAKN